MLSSMFRPPPKSRYVVPEKALALWVKQRLRREERSDGGVTFHFLVSGSTCTSMPLEVMTTVIVGADGRIVSTSARPGPRDVGCGVMCVAEGDGAAFLKDVGACEEVVGLTLEEAAFREWHVEPSGCFCTEGHRRHKWRNVFQTLHYAAATSA